MHMVQTPEREDQTPCLECARYARRGEQIAGTAPLAKRRESRLHKDAFKVEYAKKSASRHP